MKKLVVYRYIHQAFGTGTRLLFSVPVHVWERKNGVESRPSTHVLDACKHKIQMTKNTGSGV